MSILPHQWQHEKIIPFVCKKTIDELICVLQYPKFKLSMLEIENILSDYLPWTKFINIENDQITYSKLRDNSDSIFITLSEYINADFLVSGDKHILELKNVYKNIISPNEFIFLLSSKIQIP